MQIKFRISQNSPRGIWRTAGVPKDSSIIFGRPQSEIHRVAEECHADLIVVGSHARSGLALLGSTANGVMDSAM